ncbi:RNA polymerase sigma-70 factor (ECF subfamily) [Dyadobacter jejuensis]|uniref:RNA polymerase sigma-70 factor (ECF subfamily) n=1 Tax=Dyadobacter jejuensis TaxID=1082580 RepID=A0A316A7I2_9BACT|nr:sigma-70 family RNA polymerase sigma factor [Dyadobacter jejuensis]PWJ53896.1 RNA polymerase sigma-70 factor (ECF subfamily) [Dyadobacter jejuensis]
MAMTNEQQILRLVGEGDEKAFSTLFYHYHPVLYRFVLPILKSPDLAGDACQEIFIKIWLDRDKLSEIHSFRSYLLTVGKNHSLNLLKKFLSEEKTLSNFLLNYNEVNHEPEERLQFEEYNQFIQQVLQVLSPQSREVFRLCRQKGLSYDEAAGIMGISRNVIKKHMVKSMRTFRIAIEKDLGIAFTTAVTLFF